MRLYFLMILLAFNLNIAPISSGAGGIADLPNLTPGRTSAENALWIENQLSRQFSSSKRVVVAEIEGPAVITMIHFAMPQALKLNRDVLLRAYWDQEPSPSID
jgi:hypothetical protein